MFNKPVWKQLFNNLNPDEDKIMTCEWLCDFLWNSIVYFTASLKAISNLQFNNMWSGHCLSLPCSKKTVCLLSYPFLCLNSQVCVCGCITGVFSKAGNDFIWILPICPTLKHTCAHLCLELDTVQIFTAVHSVIQYTTSKLN